MNEFSLIKNFFGNRAKKNAFVRYGIGDDAAILDTSTYSSLAVTTDTLVSGVHFDNSATPYDIGYKSLAVNLSDLAAMGATPIAVTLALTLEKADEQWLSHFSQGLFELLEQFNVSLIGGDITHGPLAITVTAMGYAPQKNYLLRSAAKVGDLIFVSGTLGDAGLALQLLKEKLTIASSLKNVVLSRLYRPLPRILLGQYLNTFAHAAIDISDGLVSDLTHILNSSQVGATLFLDKLPLSDAIKSLPEDWQIKLALAAGDDYELCFTIHPDDQHQLAAFKEVSLTLIGEITENTGLTLIKKDGTRYEESLHGYQHF